MLSANGLCAGSKALAEVADTGEGPQDTPAFHL